QLTKQNGPVNDIVAYLGRAESRWLAVPATIGNQIQGPCSRIDLMKQYAGIDVQAMYPAGAPPKADNWTLDTFLKAAEACHKAGFPFGSGSGRRRIRLLPPVSSSSASAPCSSMPTGRSRSRATPCARRSTIIPGLPGSSRPLRH